MHDRDGQSYACSVQSTWFCNKLIRFSMQFIVVDNCYQFCHIFPCHWIYVGFICTLSLVGVESTEWKVHVLAYEAHEVAWVCLKC